MQLTGHQPFAMASAEPSHHYAAAGRGTEAELLFVMQQHATWVRLLFTRLELWLLKQAAVCLCLSISQLSIAKPCGNRLHLPWIKSAVLYAVQACGLCCAARAFAHADPAR